MSSEFLQVVYCVHRVAWQYHEYSKILQLVWELVVKLDVHVIELLLYQFRSFVRINQKRNDNKNGFEFHIYFCYYRLMTTASTMRMNDPEEPETPVNIVMDDEL